MQTIGIRTLKSPQRGIRLRQSVARYVRVVERSRMRALTLAKTAGAAAATAVLGGLATGPAVQSKWYQSLRKPSFQPPKQVFPIVWPLLYTDIALVSAATLDELD